MQFADVVDPADIGMVRPRGGLGFSSKPRQGPVASGGQCPYWISPRRPFAQPPPSQALELLIAEDGIAVALAQELESRHNQSGGVKHLGICGN